MAQLGGQPVPTGACRPPTYRGRAKSKAIKKK
jgi:hypothetical protein